jgi:hypothetical protein
MISYEISADHKMVHLFDDAAKNKTLSMLAYHVPSEGLTFLDQLKVESLAFICSLYQRNLITVKNKNLCVANPFHSNQTKTDELILSTNYIWHDIYILCKINWYYSRTEYLYNIFIFINRETKKKEIDNNKSNENQKNGQRKS